MLKSKLLGATAAAESLAIEDVFSTYLYTGNGSTQTITNGIDLAGEGGLVWLKTRSSVFSHKLLDTEIGLTKSRSTNATDADLTYNPSFPWISSFDADGFTLGDNAQTNFSGTTYASWTFRKAERFFDVVTYTGTGSARTIPHGLGVVPGCIIVKCTSSGTVSFAWNVYHRSLTSPAASWLLLNSTNAATSDTGSRWNNTLPTDSVFSVKGDDSTNANGQTYVAYLFAHDPLGPSGDGSDGLIACGSFTTDGSGNATVTLGYEPQYLMLKRSDSTGGWVILDTMRGLVVQATSGDKFLFAHNANAESDSYIVAPTATGFTSVGETGGLAASATYIYIAIRRGPMREPTVGTEVFDTVLATNDSQELTTGFPVDLFLQARRAVPFTAAFDRMRGSGNRLYVYNTGAESSTGGVGQFDSNTSFAPFQFGSTTSIAHWAFRRAPGFFDVVAYTGTGSARTVPHNLGVAPELMIVKKRSGGSTWPVWIKPVFDISSSGRLLLNETAERQNSSAAFNSTAPTDEVFTLGTDVDTNDSGATYIAYLFATLPGVSKVGSYTGNGSNQTINCGFTTGARFVLIKRTDSTGDWYVWDTARGIVTGNDPHLSLNTNAAEVTTDDSVDPDSTGFIVNQVAATNVNVNTATYIYLAIA